MRTHRGIAPPQAPVTAVAGAIAVRDSKNTTGPALCTPAAWAAFVTTIKTGQLDTA